MIHRYLYDAVTAGLAALVQSPEMLEDIFNWGYSLEASEIAALKTHFLAHPPTVVNGYARQDTQFPAIAIILGRESQTEEYIGEYAGSVDTEDHEAYRSDIHGGIWQASYNLEIYAQNPDVVLWYYEIVKEILIAAHAFFTEKGMFGMKISGSDMAPDPAYLPEHLFGRQLVFDCSFEYEIIDRASRLEKAFAIRGVHLDSTGSPSDPGEAVKSNVTIGDP